MNQHSLTVPAAFAGTIALACSVACQEATQPAGSETPKPTETPGAALLGAEPRIHPPGELGHAHDYSMSVETTKDCPMERPFLPAPGSVKVGVEVVLEGTSSREVPVNPFYATLHSADGNTAAATLAGCEPGLPSIRVTQGKQARGFVTFEIPVATRAFELRYAPVVIGSGPQELRFSLTR